MPRPQGYLFEGWLLAPLVLMACGCTTLSTGWWGSSPPAPPAPPAPPPSAAAVPEAALGRNKPTVTGSQLNLKPDESAAQRALELTKRLEAVEEERKSLSMRVQQLENSLEEKDKALAQASREMQAAGEELAHARDELQRWKQLTVALRDKLGGAEKENLATLQSIVSCLEQVMEHDKPAEPKRPEKEPEPPEAAPQPAAAPPAAPK